MHRAGPCILVVKRKNLIVKNGSTGAKKVVFRRTCTGAYFVPYAVGIAFLRRTDAPEHHTVICMSHAKVVRHELKSVSGLSVAII